MNEVKEKNSNILGEKITIEDGDALMLIEDAPECLKKCGDYRDLVALWCYLCMSDPVGMTIKPSFCTARVWCVFKKL